MNKHTATYNGQTFTRNSKTRIYSHCVAVRPSLDAARRHLETELTRDCHLSNYNFYREGDSFITDYKGDIEPKYVAKREQFNIDFPTFDLYLATVRTKLENDLQNRVDAGDFEQFYVDGWNSRPDLARKLVDQNITRGDCAEVVILEVRVSIS